MEGFQFFDLQAFVLLLETAQGTDGASEIVKGFEFRGFALIETGSLRGGEREGIFQREEAHGVGGHGAHGGFDLRGVRRELAKQIKEVLPVEPLLKTAGAPVGGVLLGICAVSVERPNPSFAALEPGRGTTIGRAVRQRRKALGLTQQALADRLGIAVRTLGDWEGGVHLPGTLRDRLAEWLGIPAHHLRNPFQS